MQENFAKKDVHIFIQRKKQKKKKSIFANGAHKPLLQDGGKNSAVKSAEKNICVNWVMYIKMSSIFR